MHFKVKIGASFSKTDNTIMLMRTLIMNMDTVIYSYTCDSHVTGD